MFAPLGSFIVEPLSVNLLGVVGDGEGGTELVTVPSPVPPPPPPQAASKAAPNIEVKAFLRLGEKSMSFSVFGWTPFNSRASFAGVTIC